MLPFAASHAGPGARTRHDSAPRSAAERLTGDASRHGTAAVLRAVRAWLLGSTALCEARTPGDCTWFHTCVLSEARKADQWPSSASDAARHVPMHSKLRLLQLSSCLRFDPAHINLPTLACETCCCCCLKSAKAGSCAR